VDTEAGAKLAWGGFFKNRLKWGEMLVVVAVPHLNHQVWCGVLPVYSSWEEGPSCMTHVVHCGTRGWK